MGPKPSKPSKSAESAESEATARRDALITEIRKHDEFYYQLARPAISDSEYDALMSELGALEGEHPGLLLPDSPTQRVGGSPVPQLVSVEHRQPMLSLANTYNREEVLDWCGSIADYLGVAGDEIPFSIEPKLDGVAIELVYERGELIRAITRGDGRVGDDVTHTVRTIRGLPLVLEARKAPELLEVRGEVIITRASFERINEARRQADEPLFINPRNLTTGTLKTLDPAVASSRPMSLVIYGLGVVEAMTWSSHSEAMAALGDMGLATSGPLAATGDLDTVLDKHDELLAGRDDLAFDVDGSVIKVDSVELQRRLGVRSRSPRWAIAFKYPARQGSSIVREIQVLVGRTGALTPRAVVEPVHVGGVTIEHISLFNRDEVERLGVKVGDRVLIERAGDVIPHIVEVSEPGTGKPFVMPDRCPVCETPVEEIEDEVVVRCPNPGCPAVLRRRIGHFVSRGAMDVEGVGEKLIDQLVETSMVGRLSDLYALDVEALAGLDRMGKQSAANVLTGLEQSKTQTLSRLIYGLGIRHIGEHVAELLANHWPSLEQIRAADEDDLLGANEVGPAVAASLARWSEDADEQADLDRMLELGVAPTAPTPARGEDGVLSGRTFLFTGTLELMTRREAHERVKAAGGRLLSGVSKKLDVLVVGAKPGSKLAAAKELGVEVMEEKDFVELVGGDV